MKRDWSDDAPLLPDISVSDHKPVKTGILDSRGKPIKRPPRPIGFHNPRDRL